MIVRIVVRVLLWAFVAVLIAGFLYPYVKPKYIYYKVTTHPLLQEFKRCQLVKYEYISEGGNPYTIKDFINPRYKGIDFFYVDTLSDLGIKYNYSIHVELNGAMVVRASPDWNIDLSDSGSVVKGINRLESDSALTGLIKNSDAAECHFESPDFVYTGPHDIIKYNNKSGVMYFQIAKPPAQLRLSPFTEVFQKMAKEKGFDFGDFDSLRFIKYITMPDESTAVVSAWRFQGFAAAFKKDIMEIGNYGQVPVNLKFLTDPDLIDPHFLAPLVLARLSAAGLPVEYIQQSLSLRETGANRLADYYKKEGKIIEATRVVGYCQFKWTTESWIDRLHGGVMIRLYFTHFMDRENIELVRIGTSPDNFHESISLHPIANIIDLDAIKQIAPWADTSKTGFKLSKAGGIMMTFTHGKDEYEVDVEKGAFIKQRKATRKSRTVPDDRRLYTEMDSTINARRGKQE